jgi:hypothetical protein
MSSSPTPIRSQAHDKTERKAFNISFSSVLSVYGVMKSDDLEVGDQKTTLPRDHALQHLEIRISRDMHVELLEDELELLPCLLLGSALRYWGWDGGGMGAGMA